MKVLELFAGTRSIGKAFEAHNHEVFSVDLDKSLEGIDYCGDVLELTAQYIVKEFGKPDVIWASPDCTTYSIAAISKHRHREESGNLAPKTEYARYCDLVNIYTHNLIMALSPNLWYIENPRGGLRKMEFMKGLTRYTVTYCAYGDMRMKPTDIWTNHPNPRFLPMCKNGDPCHEKAPRGSKTGTQRLQKRERSKIPQRLCEHIVDISEEFLEV